MALEDAQLKNKRRFRLVIWFLVIPIIFLFVVGLSIYLANRLGLIEKLPLRAQEQFKEDALDHTLEKWAVYGACLFILLLFIVTC